MLDPVRKCFGYGHYGPHVGSDFLHPIWSSSSKEGPDHIVQNQPRSDLNGLVGFLPDASGPEAGQRTRITEPGSSRTVPAHHQFPTFRLSCILSQEPWIILYKTSLDPIRFWLTVSGLGLADPVWKQAGVKISWGQVLDNSFKLIGIKSVMFTGSGLELSCSLGQDWNCHVYWVRIGTVMFTGSISASHNPSSFLKPHNY